jgi:hypothetical protein
MLDQEDTGFEFPIPPNENGRHSSKPEGVGGNEIFRIGGQVVLLTAAQAKVTNLLGDCSQLLFTEDEIGGSLAAIQQRAGALPVAGKAIGHAVVCTK